MHWDTEHGCVATCGDDGHVKVWALEGEALKPQGNGFDVHPDGARGVLVHGGFGLVLSCGDDGVLKAFKMADEWGLAPLSSREHPSVVFNLQYHMQEKSLLSCSMDGSLKAWRVSPTGELHPHAETQDGEAGPTLAMKYDPTDRIVFTAGLEGSIHVWRLEDGRITHVTTHQEAHEGIIRSLQFDRAKRILLSAGEDGSFRAWHLKEKRLVQIAAFDQALESGVNVIGLHSATTLVAAGADASLSVWEMGAKTFKEVFRLDAAHVHVINVLHCESDISAVFTGCHSVRIWRFENSALTELHSLPHPFGRSHSISALRYSLKLSLLVGGSTTGALRCWFYHGARTHVAPVVLWDVENAQARGSVSLIFESDLGLLFTGGNNKTLKCWELQGSKLEQLATATERGTSRIFTACPKQH